MTVTIIAEAGVNHNGDISLAKLLVDAAVDAGANIVKFQTIRADAMVTRNAPKAAYQSKLANGNESQYEMLKQLELSKETHEILIGYCKEKGIEFLSTAFDIESVIFLAELGQQCFKIPSGEITNLPYLRYIGSLGKKIIISTGMSTLSEIEQALNILQQAGMLRQLISILHCNTDYPTLMEDVNLHAMSNIRRTFGLSVGYSDHTMGIEVPIAAVALGAEIIEKHITLDRSLPGPDHKASIEPDELKSMVKAIRNIEKALGNGIKKPSLSEMKNIPIVRKSIVASVAINCGEIFTADNLTVKRPGTGISPMRWDEIIGKVSYRNYAVDELIET